MFIIFDSLKNFGLEFFVIFTFIILIYVVFESLLVLEIRVIFIGFIIKF